MINDLWRGADLNDMESRVLCADSECERTLDEMWRVPLAGSERLSCLVDGALWCLWSRVMEAADMGMGAGSEFWAALVWLEAADTWSEYMVL